MSDKTLLGRLKRLEHALRVTEDNPIFADDCLSGIKELERLQAKCERLRDLVKKAYWEGVETQYGHSGPLHILTAWSTSSVKNQLQEMDDD